MLSNELRIAIHKILTVVNYLKVSQPPYGLSRCKEVEFIFPSPLPLWKTSEFLEFARGLLKYHHSKMAAYITLRYHLRGFHVPRQLIIIKFFKRKHHFQRMNLVAYFFFFFLNKDHSKIIQKFIYKDKTRFGKAFNELPSLHILPSLNPLLHFVFNSGLQRCVPAGGAKYIQGCIRRYY